MKKNVTQKDIAKEANVSRELVSIVLSGKDVDTKRCRPEIRKNILAIASKYNYRTNRSAAFMKSRRHGSLGFLVKDFGQIQHDLFATIVPEAKKHACALLLEQLPEDLNSSVMMLDDYVVDGLIVFSELPEEIMERVEKVQEPVLYFNTNQREGRNVITVADEQGGYDAVETLAKAGRKKIAYICWGNVSVEHYSTMARKQGIIDGCRKLGLNFVKEIYINDIPHSPDNFNKVAAIIKEKTENEDIDGVVLHSDLLASPFYKAVHNMGKSIPNDYSVISFNNSLVAYSTNPELTSLGLDNDDVSNKIVTRLIDLINNKEDLDTITVNLKVFNRESV
jgi:LacI family transcriptional regulator